MTGPKGIDDAQPRRQGALDVAALVEQHASGLLTYLARMVGDVNLAEDLAHDAFVRALDPATSPPRRGSERAWLFRIARNLAIDHARSARVRRAAETDLVQRALRAVRSTDLPGAALRQRELVTALERAVAGLPEELRTAFLLREVEGLSYAEIAQATEANGKTVSTRLHRARRHLEKALGGLLDDAALQRRAEP